MIKAVGTTKGRKVLMLGLSFGNLDQFKNHPGDTYIHIDGAALGLPIDVMLFSGQTEDDCTKMVMAGITPGTRVRREGA